MVTSALLTHYFHPTKHNHWIIVPEFNVISDDINEFNCPDYTLFLIEDVYQYTINMKTIVELKSKVGKSWFQLVEQMRYQCYLASDVYDFKFLVIGQKGLEICFFKYDITKYIYQNPECFRNFEPLNLHNLQIPQLDELNVKYIECNDNGFSRVAVIKWNLNDENHAKYIDEMFQHIRSKMIN